MEIQSEIGSFNTKFKNQTVDYSSIDQQLSFDEFIETEDNSAKLASIPYVEYKLINPKKFEFPQKRFFILSVAAHVMILLYALSIVVEKMQKTEIVEVSYLSNSALPPAPVSFSATEQLALQPESEALLEEPAEVIKPVAKAPVKAAKTTKAAAKSLKAIAPAKAFTQTNTAAAKSKSSGAPIVAEPLATVSDIEIPVLTEISDQPSQNFSTKEIESDFDKIDESDNDKIIAATQVDAKLLEDSMNDLDQTSTALAGEESIVDGVATEQLQKLKDQKEQIKRAKQAAAAAAASSPRGNPQVIATKRAGTGNDDTALSNTSAGGVQSGVGAQSDGIVRSLEDLKQKPGNPRPNYDVTDRMNGLSGTIIFNAYVTKEGNLTLFRLIQSTGHRNLDRKTLAALKNWKFYPGQEGWVELPFKWDLKGGVQQKPTLLKRK